ncbi:MAG: diguanylate cyclase [Lachnospiraceae bacterium]|nr:diguanylate cyclase [Lachnospiraceae bacterium]
MDYKVLYLSTMVLFILLFATLFVLENKTRITRSTPLNSLYICVMFISILDIIWVLVNGQPQYVEFNRIVNILDLTGLVVLGYLWMLTMYDLLPDRQSWFYRRRHLGLIVVCMSAAVYVISAYWTGWTFSVSPDGVYQRGPLHFIPTIMTFLYMIIGACRAGVARRKASFSHEKSRYFAIEVFPIPAFMVSIVQLVLPTGIPTMQFGCFMGLLILYGVNQNTRITRDFLTNLANRYAFEIILKKKIDKHNREPDGATRLYVLEGDLNGFKKINDVFGHPEGDNALTVTAYVLDKIVPSHGGVVARTGGDEFMMAVEAAEEKTIYNMIDEIDAGLEEVSRDLSYELSMSIGVAEYEDLTEFQMVIAEADRKLYEAKRVYKEALAAKEAGTGDSRR